MNNSRTTLNSAVTRNRGSVSAGTTVPVLDLCLLTVALGGARQRKIMEENKIFTLVVLEKNKYIGVLSMHDLVEARIL